MSDVFTLPPPFRDMLTERNVSKNATLQSFDRINEQVHRLAEDIESIGCVLDIGWGSG